MKELQIFRGFHGIDCFHLLRNLKRKVPHEQFVLFKQLVLTKNPFKFDNILNKLIEENGNDHDGILSSLLKNKESYCYSQTPARFIGLVLSTAGG